MCGATSSKIAAVGAAALLLSGCALIVQGTSQEVHFTSDPDGATFSVAGQTATTPKKLTIPKDDYKIVFTKPGYEDAIVPLTRKVSSYFIWSIVGGVITSAIDILSGAWKEFATTEVHGVLTPRPEVPEEIETMITSDPSGAEITIQGAAAGRTPKRVTLMWYMADRERKVTLRLAEYKTANVALPHGKKELHAKLEPDPEPADVIVRSDPPGAEVWAGGHRVGQTNGTIRVFWEPKQRTQMAELKKEGYRDQKLELVRGEKEFDAGALAELAVDVTLDVQAQPPGAEIEADGKVLGTAPGKIVLRWPTSRASYMLRISHPGYASADVPVTRDTARKPVEVRLTPVIPKVP